MTITHVSDTARWVAVYRAMESERPDALFRDPFARRLAGAVGEEIVRKMPRGHSSAWAMIVRTAVLDELIEDAISRRGCTQVVNLAAGLDARPWRLTLPPALRWVDVDFADVLEYKAGVIGAAPAACSYEAAPADLTDRAARAALFGRLGADGLPTLVIAEGLLIYLDPAEVDALGRDLHAIPSFTHWLIDLSSPLLLQWMARSWGRALERGNAPFRFGPAEGLDYFRQAGWQPATVRWGLEESRRLRREMRLIWLWRFLGRFASAERRERVRRMSALALLERAS